MNNRNLFLLITAILAVFLVGGGFLLSGLVRAKLTDNLISQYAVQDGLAAGQVAHTLELEIAQTEEKLELISQLPEIVSGSADACNAKLAELVADPKIKVGNLGRVDEKGVFRCTVNRKLLGVKADTLGAYIDDIFSDPAHKPVMSRAIKPPGSSSYVVAIHVPVWGPGGKFLGTLGGAVYLDALEQQYLQNPPLLSGGYVGLYDDDGTVLYHYRPELIGLNIASIQFQRYVAGGSPPAQSIRDIQAGTSGTRRYFFDGDEKIGAFEPVHVFPGRNWRVSFVIPVSSVRASLVTIGIDRLLSELPIGLGVLVALLFLIFFWTIRRKVFRPMEEIDKAKSEFIGIASHELRTPLGIIKWYIEAIKTNDYIRKSPDKALEYMNEVEKSNERLLELVRDLLAVAHIEAGREASAPKSVNAADALREAVGEMAIEAEKKRISVETAFPKDSVPEVLLDPARLKEVLQNILSNAIKYSPEGTEVKASLEKSGGEILISVRDRGIGIPQGAAAGMFGKFFRADNAMAAATEGNGLGLYVVRSYVEAWGGKIWYESEEGRGTVFFLTIPLEISSKKKANE